MGIRGRVWVKMIIGLPASLVSRKHNRLMGAYPVRWFPFARGIGDISSDDTASLMRFRECLAGVTQGETRYQA